MLYNTSRETGQATDGGGKRYRWIDLIMISSSRYINILGEDSVHVPQSLDQQP